MKSTLTFYARLNTESKLFGESSSLLGSLPLLNQEAVQKALCFAKKAGSKISPLLTFDRKLHFSLDTPRNYQITQIENPLLIGGTIQNVPLLYSYLEEERSFDPYLAGMPLLTIVMDSISYEATTSLYFLLLSLNIIEEHSFRMDLTVSNKKIQNIESLKDIHSAEKLLHQEQVKGIYQLDRETKLVFISSLEEQNYFIPDPDLFPLQTHTFFKE